MHETLNSTLTPDLFEQEEAQIMTTLEDAGEAALARGSLADNSSNVSATTAAAAASAVQPAKSLTGGTASAELGPEAVEGGLKASKDDGRRGGPGPPTPAALDPTARLTQVSFCPRTLAVHLRSSLALDPTMRLMQGPSCLRPAAQLRCHSALDPAAYFGCQSALKPEVYLGCHSALDPAAIGKCHSVLHPAHISGVVSH